MVTFSRAEMPLCAACRLLESDAPPTCAAYPTGVPDEIWSGGGDHREPRGDGDLAVFSLDPASSLLYETWLEIHDPEALE